MADAVVIDLVSPRGTAISGGRPLDRNDMIRNAAYSVSTSTALPLRKGAGSTDERERPTVRVVAIYGTSWSVPESGRLTPVADQLDIAGFADASRGVQLPTVLGQASHEPSSLRTPRGKAGERSLGVTTWLFALPSGRLVAALALDVVGTAEDLRPLLADLVDGDAEVGGQTLAEAFAMSGHGSGGLAPERHVIASFSEPNGLGLDREGVRSLLYPASQVNGSAELLVHRPAELAADGAVWLSPHVTVATGQPTGLGNALVLSAVVAVGAATRLREVRAAAYDAVGSYRAAAGELRSTHGSRRFLETITNRIGDLEAELAFSVDAATDPGAVFPYRPVESYHRTLVRVLDLSGRALAVGRMLSRLAQGVAAELVAVASAEWRLEDRRRALWNVAVWVLALIGIPAAIAIAYAGREGGYTDEGDVRAYVIAGAVALVLLVAYAVIASTIRRRTRARDRE
jgi:hypothetical protein